MAGRMGAWRWAAGMLLPGLAAALDPSAAAAQQWETVTKSRLLRGESAMDVSVDYVAGRFALHPAERGVLYRIDSRYDAGNFTLRADYADSDERGRLRVDVEGEGSVDLQQLTREGLGAGSLEMAISPEIPIRLNVELGASEARLELGGLRLTDLSMRTGATDARITFGRPNPETAETCRFRAGAASFRIEGLGNSGCRRMQFEGGVGVLELDFTGDWNHRAVASIQIGLGTVNIRVPTDLPVRIERSTFLMTFSAPGFRKEAGDHWVSGDWEGAERGLTIDLEGALGTVTVSRR